MARFKNALIVGGTQLLESAARSVEKYNVAENVLLVYCNKNGFGDNQSGSMQISEKQELMRLLTEQTEETLVLSVMNPWLFTKEALDNKNLLVVNLHHALLPKHRGRNAEAWAIYEGDDTAGVTWHKVDNGIDTGGIYIQKQVEITDKTTSLKLLSQLNNVAVIGLDEIFENDLLDKPPLPQPSSDERIHLSKDKPNNANFDLNWNYESSSRFLRAMDYGILQVMGKPRISLPQGEFTFSVWKMIDESDDTITSNKFEFDPEKCEAVVYYENGKKIVLKKLVKECSSLTDV